MFICNRYYRPQRRTKRAILISFSLFLSLSSPLLLKRCSIRSTRVFKTNTPEIACKAPRGITQPWKIKILSKTVHSRDIIRQAAEIPRTRIRFAWWMKTTFAGIPYKEQQFADGINRLLSASIAIAPPGLRKGDVGLFFQANRIYLAECLH